MERPLAGALAPDHDEKSSRMTDVFHRFVEVDSPSPELLAEVREVLAPEFLGHAFKKPEGETDQKINLAQARQTFRILQLKDFHLKLVSDIINEKYDRCWSRLCHVQFDHTLLRALSLILMCPAFDHPDEEWCRKIIVLVAETLSKLGTSESQDAFETLGNWWQHDKCLLRRVILVLKEGLLALRRSTAYTEISSVFVLIDALEHLNKVNERKHRIVSYRLFYLRDIEETELLNHLIAYDRMRALNIQDGFNWIHRLFLIDVASKWKLIELSANHMQDSVSSAISFHNYLLRTFPLLRMPLLHDLHSPTMKFVNVRRGSGIVQSAMENVDRHWNAAEATLWLKPLEVHFMDEKAEDQGGPKKEFFYEFFREVMNTENLSIFRRVDDQNMWFNADNMDFRTLEKIGFLFALCLHNDSIVTIPFPLLLYEKLLNKKPVAHEDLRRLDPKHYRRLEDLREYSAKQIEKLNLSFAGLQRDGENIEVTQGNLKEYIDKTSFHQLAPVHLDAFRLGFNKIPKPDLFFRFKPEELQDVIIGEKFDWKSFENSTSYNLPYKADHPAIRLFWRVFHEFDEDRKKRYLQILTGAVHVPIGGFRSLGFTIGRMDTRRNPSEIIPAFMTCKGFMSMGLPEYESEDDVRSRLLATMERTPSFNLERPRNVYQ